MARATAKRPEVLNPLAIIEQYAQEDLVRQSEQFLDTAARIVSTWGDAHQTAIARLVERPLAVTDATTYAQLGEWLKEAAEREKEATAFFEPRKSLGFKLHRLICDRETTIVKPLRLWLQRAKDSWDRFRRQEEQRRRDEEQRLAEEARRAEQERMAREAELLEQRGEPELAQQVLEQAVHAPAPVFAIASTLPEVRGISTAANWRWRPVGGDTPQARARAEKLVPREFLELSERKLTAHAKAHGASARVPGIEFYDAGSVRVRA
jgi:hypothetical protein